jgi:predicted dehydrogenase
MITIAMIDGTDAYHGRAFAGFFNRVDSEEFRRHDWPLFGNRFAGRARITHVWGEDRQATEELARAADIPNVMERPEDAVGQVSAAMLVDNLKMTHQRHAPGLIEAGLPLFIDKPLSPDWEEAQSIVRLARERTVPVLSTSALRYANEITNREAIAEQVGEILTCSGAGTNELFFYGIHSLTLMVTVMGSPVESVLNVGRPGEHIVRLQFVDGRQGVLTVYEEGMAGTFEVAIHGTKGHARVAARDAEGFYGNTLAEFVRMVETEEPPVPYEETLNIIRALMLARESLRDGRERICEV